MDKAIISGCLIAFALFALGVNIHAHIAQHGTPTAQLVDKTVEPEESQQDHITTALRNLANGKFKI